MIAVPDQLVHHLERSFGAEGTAWARAMPDLIANACREWDLVRDGDPMTGHLGMVLPVRCGAEPLVLRLAWVNESTEPELEALRAWDGNGAVRLVAAKQEEGLSLLERLDHRRSLESLPIEEAVQIAGRLLRRLAIPAPAGIPRLRDAAARLAAGFIPRWEEQGRPMPRERIERAVEAAESLGPDAQDLLVHLDLHYGNVLAGTREPWLAIDPQVIAGDPEYGLAALLLRRLDETNGRQGLLDRFDALIAAGGFDRARAHGWVTVRLTDYWLWALGIGLTEDPVRCHAILEWLDPSHQ